MSLNVIELNKTQANKTLRWLSMNDYANRKRYEGQEIDRLDIRVRQLKHIFENTGFYLFFSPISPI